MSLNNTQGTVSNILDLGAVNPEKKQSKAISSRSNSNKDKVSVNMKEGREREERSNSKSLSRKSNLFSKRDKSSNHDRSVDTHGKSTSLSRGEFDLMSYKKFMGICKSIIKDKLRSSKYS